MFDLLGKNKKKEDMILSIISVSKVTSINEISEISGFSNEEVYTLVEKMISKSKNDNTYKLFKNAHIDRKNNEVVIEKFAKGGKSDATSIIKGLLGLKEDWKCAYCSAMNKSKSNKCISCGAGIS